MKRRNHINRDLLSDSVQQMNRLRDSRIVLITLEEAGTHEGAKTHASTVFVTRSLDL